MSKERSLRIVFAGGGSGGHFYPIVAVAEALQGIVERERLTPPSLYYVSDSPYDKDTLVRLGMRYVEIPTGKQRTYFSIQNFFDVFKTLYGATIALFRMFFVYPDVIFGKGGYASFPALFAAKILKIPVVIHESDIIPGKVNRWAGKFAAKVAVSYPEAIKYFPFQDRVALTGQPIRSSLITMPEGDPYAALGLSSDLPVILVIGGSQGAERINEDIVDLLPELLKQYQVVHQTGEKNYDWILKRAQATLVKNADAGRYHPFPYLDSALLNHAGKAAALVISRAGSSVFEIALWGKPSILIPLPISREDHQKENAYSYARTGAATVIEEENLKPGVLLSVVRSIMDDPGKRDAMGKATRAFAKTDAAEKIALALLSIATKHD